MRKEDLGARAMYGKTRKEDEKYFKKHRDEKASPFMWEEDFQSEPSHQRTPSPLKEFKRQIELEEMAMRVQEENERVENEILERLGGGGNESDMGMDSDDEYY